MRRVVMMTRSRKRRPITRRRGRSRVWIGSRPRTGTARPLFLALRTQQMRRPRPSEWLGAAAMLLGMASWGVLAALLAA